MNAPACPSQETEQREPHVPDEVAPRLPSRAQAYLRRRPVVRTLAVLVLLVSVAYLTWRALFTLEGATTWLAVTFLVLEAGATAALALRLHDLWDTSPRPPLPPLGEVVDVNTLSVAVLIPTYDEPFDVLLPTIAAATSAHGEHQTWVLDDQYRPWVAALASQLGAGYRSRVLGSDAKAGNLNDALAVIDADVVAVIDADHVVADTFLTALLPYLADPRVAVVQSPPQFYNTDSIEHMADRRGRVVTEQEIFYSEVLAGRSRWNAVQWCGTNALLRTRALREVGGVATGSLTEDLATSLKLLRAGWRIAYHGEVLATGLAAQDAHSFYVQRRRWAGGAMQILRTDNPAVGPGLSVHQRISYLAELLSWFESWRTMGTLVIPMLAVWASLTPLNTSVLTFGIASTAVAVAQRLVCVALAGRGMPVRANLLIDALRLAPALAATGTLLTGRPQQPDASPPADARPGARQDGTVLLALLAACGLGTLAWWTAGILGAVHVSYPNPTIAAMCAAWVALNTCTLTWALWTLRRLRRVPQTAVDAGDQAPVVVLNAPGRLPITGALHEASVTHLLARVPAAGGELRVGDSVMANLTFPAPGERQMRVMTQVREVRTAATQGHTDLVLRVEEAAGQLARIALALHRPAPVTADEPRA